MLAKREKPSIAEQILANQDAIKAGIKTINDRAALEQNLRTRQAMGDTFVAMSSGIFQRAARDGALTQPVSEICSGLTMFGIGWATSNPTQMLMGAFQTVMGLASFGEDDEEFVSQQQQTMLALYGMAKMIEDGFNLVLQRQAFHSLQIDQLSNQITRMEKFLEKTQKENYLKDFKTLMSRLKNTVDEVGVKAKMSQVINDLLTLQAWIEPQGHAYRATVTGSVLIADVNTNTGSSHAERLSQSGFDHLGMIGYLAALLEQYVPHRLTEPLKHKLPNLSILLEASLLYKQTINQFHPPGNIAPMFAKIAEQWRMVADYLKTLATNNAHWDGLCAQIQDYACQANQYLAFLEKNNKFTAGEGSIDALIPKESSEKIRLMDLLDQIEARRWLIIRFLEILGKPPALMSRIEALPNKSKILARTRASLQEANKLSSIAIDEHNIVATKAALDAGANYNLFVRNTSWTMGSLNNKSHFTERRVGIKMLDLLLEHASSFNPPEMDSFYWHSTTGGIRACPINVIIGYGCFEQLILVIAQGYFDISESTSRTGDRRVVSDYSHGNVNWLRTWMGGASHPQYAILLAILRDINKPDGILNKEALRHGYQLFRAIQYDDAAKMEELLRKPIKPAVLYWLTVLLDDIKPIQELEARHLIMAGQLQNRNVDIAYNETTYSPLQLAILLGRSAEVLNLIFKFFPLQDPSLTEPISGKKLIPFAIEQGYLNLAKILMLKRFDCTPEERTRLATLPVPMPIVPARPAEEKDSLGKKCLAYSEFFARAAHREQAREDIDAETERLIKAGNYAHAAKRVLYVLVPKGLSEEMADAFLQDCARHDFVAVVLLKLNSLNEMFLTMLRKHMSPILTKYQTHDNVPDLIAFCKTISDKIAALPPSEALTDTSIINLIESTMEQLFTPGLSSQLPPQLEPMKDYIDKGFWKVIKLKAAKFDDPLKKKLLNYLLDNYAEVEGGNEAFDGLIDGLKKDTKMETVTIHATANAFPRVTAPSSFFMRSQGEQKSNAPRARQLNFSGTFDED